MMAAARAAAAAAAKAIGGSATAAASSSAAGGVPAAAAAGGNAAKRAAADAFAASLKKKSRWGDGSRALVDAPAPAANPGKAQQALVVSQLQDKLAAFRKDRGVEAPVDASTVSIKLFVPEKEEWMQFPRNWVGIFIGRDGINKKRFEEEVPGARIFVRGEGTQLRGMNGQKEEDIEAMHVYLEADNQDALDLARVKILAILNPKSGSSALTLFDEKQIINAALEKTTDSEECAFCGKPGHHHSKCPKRRSTFTMSGVKCAACGSTGHTARDCKGDKSNIVNMAGHSRGPAPSSFEDADFAAFEAELLRRSS